MAGVIRDQQVAAAARPFSFADLEAQGREILRRAEERAQEIRRAAQVESRAVAAREKAAARAAGLAEGREAGQTQAYEEAHAAALQESRERVAGLADALLELLKEFEGAKRGLLAAAESGVIELALAIARRVCKRAAAESPEAAAANARALLELVKHAEDPELHLNARDCELLSQAGARALAGAERLEHVRIVADETVAPGGCRLVTRHGELDAGVEVQLERIAAALRA